MACSGCPQNAYSPALAAAARAQEAGLAMAASQQRAHQAFTLAAHDRAAAESTKAAIAAAMSQAAADRVLADAQQWLDDKRTMEQFEADPGMQAAYAKWEKRQQAAQKGRATKDAKRQAQAWEAYGAGLRQNAAVDAQAVADVVAMRAAARREGFGG